MIVRVESTGIDECLKALHHPRLYLVFASARQAMIDRILDGAPS